MYDDHDDYDDDDDDDDDDDYDDDHDDYYYYDDDGHHDCFNPHFCFPTSPLCGLNSLHPRWATAPPAPPAAPAGDAAPCSRRQRRKSPCQAWFGATATMRKYQNHWLQREGLGLGTLI